jgi:hypothetical protein
MSRAVHGSSSVGALGPELVEQVAEPRSLDVVKKLSHVRVL